MIDHIGIPVRNHAASRAFYLRALAPLGIGVVMEVSKEQSGGPSDYTGFGAEGNPFFWIGEATSADRYTWRSQRQDAGRSTLSIVPPSKPALGTTARRESVRTTIPTTTALS